MILLDLSHQLGLRPSLRIKFYLLLILALSNESLELVSLHFKLLLCLLNVSMYIFHFYAHFKLFIVLCSASGLLSKLYFVLYSIELRPTELIAHLLSYIPSAILLRRWLVNKILNVPWRAAIQQLLSHDVRFCICFLLQKAPISQLKHITEPTHVI